MAPPGSGGRRRNASPKEAAKSPQRAVARATGPEASPALATPGDAGLWGDSMADHVQLLMDPRHAGHAETARIVVQLQASHGNSYVEQVVGEVRLREEAAAEAPAVTPAVQAVADAPAATDAPVVEPPGPTVQRKAAAPAKKPARKPKKATGPQGPMSGLKPGEVADRRKAEFAEKSGGFKTSAKTTLGVAVGVKGIDWASEAGKAAEPPKNDAKSQGKAIHIGDMAGAKPGVFDEASFIAAVKQAVAAASPKNLDEAGDFADKGGGKKMKGAVEGELKDSKSDAEHDIKETAKQAPDPTKAKKKPVVPLPAHNPGVSLPNPGAKGAMPGPVAPGEIDLSTAGAETDALLASEEVTDQMLLNSEEPQFIAAAGDKHAAAAHSASAPGQLRGHERGVLADARTGIEGTQKTTLAGMLGLRAGAFSQADGTQKGAKTGDEARRLEVATRVEGIYDKTKTDVKGIFADLDKKVDSSFDGGEKGARDEFDTKLQKDFKAWKKDRYGGFTGKFKWAKDKLMGLPKEVNDIFGAARDFYVMRMDKVIKNVAKVVTSGLNAATKRIAAGREEVHTYVNSLPVDLRKVGTEAEKAIAGRFSQLDEDVAAKGDELVAEVSRRYTEAANAVDSEIEKMKEKNRGLWQKAKDAVAGVIVIIKQIKELISEILEGATETLKAIIRSPRDYLRNLLGAIVGGAWEWLAEFPSNFMDTLMQLFTKIQEGAAVAIPKSFDPKELFGFVVSVVGLSYSRIRNRLATLLGKGGEKIVSWLEKGWSKIEAAQDKIEAKRAAKSGSSSSSAEPADAAQTLLVPGEAPAVQRQEGEGEAGGGGGGGGGELTAAAESYENAPVDAEEEGGEEGPAEGALGFFPALMQGPGGLLGWAAGAAASAGAIAMTIFSDIWHSFVDKAKDFIVHKVAAAAVQWIASAFTPVGSFIRAAKMIYDVGKWLWTNLNKGLAVVTNFLQAFKLVATAGIALAKTWIITTLKRFAPLFLDMMAALVGVGEVIGRIRGLFAAVATPVQKVVDKILKAVAKMARRLYGRKGTGEEEVGPEKMEGGTQNRGSIAIVGTDVGDDKAWTWSVDQPVKADDILAALKAMRAGLTMDQERVRDEAFDKAEKWIKERQNEGGLDATEGRKKNDFFNDYLPAQYKTARIQIIVLDGIALI